MSFIGIVLVVLLLVVLIDYLSRSALGARARGLGRCKLPWAHTWERWSTPYSRGYTLVRFTKVVGDGVEYYQKRECTACGKLQIRNLEQP